MKQIKTIGFDADDTLWYNERFFGEAQTALKILLQKYADEKIVSDAVLEMQRENVVTMGYGIKSFTISMMEVALNLSNGKLDAKSMTEVISIGRNMMAHPVDFLPGVTDVLEELSSDYELVLITKGDLIDQERKVNMSDLGRWFKHIEIVSEKQPMTYQTIFNRFGSMNQSAMIGNSIKSDVVPAVLAGSWGIHVPYEVTWDLELAEPMTEHERYFEAKDLAQASDIIRSI